MQLKNGLLIWLTSLVLTGLTSCLSSNEDYVDPVVSTDAQLVAFGISSDSIKTLASVVFSIDQVKGEIYNNDSLPYLTKLDSIGKVKLSFTTGLGLASSVRVEYPKNDTVWVATGDSIRPDNLLKLQVYAQKSEIIKTYTVHFNIHQIDPDSVQYHSINPSKIPVSTSPDYNALTSNCPYPVKAALGFLHPDTQKGLALVVEKDSKNVFAYSENLTNYDYSDTEIPSNFPLSRFSRVNSTNFGRPPLTIIENLQSAWTTEDGLYWINLSNISNKALPNIEGGSAFAYNNEIWFILGHIKDGDYNDKVYYSQDGGIIWKTKPTKTQVPEGFILRKNAEVIVEGKYFYINGGEILVAPSTGYDSLPLHDAWQAVLNSQLFAD